MFILLLSFKMFSEFYSVQHHQNVLMCSENQIMEFIHLMHLILQYLTWWYKITGNSWLVSF